VNHAAGVGLCDGFDHGQEKLAHLRFVEFAPSALDESRKIFADEQLLNDERSAAFLFADVEDVDDVWVPDEVCRACFAKETLHDLSVLRVLGTQDLDGNRAPDVLVDRAINVAHGAASEQLLEAVLGCEYLANATV
jgi:hypothetical protein